MAEPTSPEPATSAEASAAASTQAGIRPDATPNRDRRREPPVLDLKAERSETKSEAPPPPEAAAKAEAPEPPSAEPAKAASEPRPRRGGRWLLAFGCGIVLALGLAAGAYFVFADQGEVAAGLQKQIAALQGRIDALETHAKTVASSATLETLDQRLAAAQTAAGNAAAELDKRIAALGKQTADAQAGTTAAAEALGKRVAALEAAAASTKIAIDDASAKAQQARIEVAQAVVALAAARAIPGMPVTLPPPVDISPLEDRLGKLEARIVAIETSLAAEKTQVRATEVRAERPAENATAATFAAAARALVETVDKGLPFKAELASLESQGASGERIETLRPYAPSGVPTTEALAAQFAAIAGKLTAAQSPPAAGGLFGRLSGLVQVRPVGAPKAQDLRAPLAGIEAALAQGKLGEALVLWGKLPASVQAASRDWAKAAQARLAVSAAAQSLLSDAMAAAGKSKT
jgi:hypothetical protein